jgi:hypothetical protein
VFYLLFSSAISSFSFLMLQILIFTLFLVICITQAEDFLKLMKIS